MDIRSTLSYQMGVIKSYPRTEAVLRERHAILATKIASHDRHLGDIELSRVFYQKAIDLVYSRSIGELEKLLNTALEYVFFDKVYKIKIDLTERYGKSLEFKVVDNSFSPPLELSTENGVGCGVRTLISFVLQVFYLVNRNAAPVLFLDEHLSAISQDYVDRFMSFLNGLAKEKGLTVVLITHDRRFMDFAQKTYKVTDGNIELIQQEQKT